MSVHSTTILKKAWGKVVNDMEGRTFFVHPYEKALIENDLDGWIGRLSHELEHGQYMPTPAELCEVPKPNYGIRPGLILTLKDQVVYAAYIETIYSQIFSGLKWSQGIVDFAYQLRHPDKTDSGWFFNRFSGWKQFQAQTKKRIKEGAKYVVFADICGFYENIQIDALFSDLRTLNSDSKSNILMQNCLRTWSTATQSKGIPQGCSPSDILAKLYLNYVDHSLARKEIQHIRYVDDFRLFCNTPIECRLAIKELIACLRERGLNLQTAKTKVLDAKTALEEISRVENVIEPLVAELNRQASQFIEIPDDPYGVPSFILDEVFSSNPQEAPRKVIQEAFDTHFHKKADKTHFDKTVFHYLLARLTAFKDGYAVPYCEQILYKQPQETEYILKYLSKLNKIDDFLPELTNFLKSSNAIYPYQGYLIMRCLCAHSSQTLPDLISIAWEFTQSPHYYLRSVSWDYLGKFGELHDLERIRNGYGRQLDIEQCDILIALRRWEKGKRNEMYGRVGKSSHYHSSAVAYAKTHS